MKVLHVLDHSVPLHSGYSFRTLAILREQRRLGWQTAQLTSTKHEISVAAELPEHRPPHERTTEEIDGFEFHRTPHRGRLTTRIPVLNQCAVVTALRRRLTDVTKHFKPDVMHAHSPSLNGLAASAVARRYGASFVYEVRALWEDAAVDHGTTREGSVRYVVTRALENRVLRRADAVVVICEGLRREVIARGLPESRVSVVPNAVDIEAFSRPRSSKTQHADRLGLSGHQVLGFIGSFYGYEGLSLLLDALPAVMSRRPATKVLLVGGGFQEQALRRRVSEKGLEGSVVFTGRVPHDGVQAYYDAIDVLVYPRLSLRVTEMVTPLKPLEAMASRGLVVASDVGGHRELIRDNDTGLLFRAGDASALASRLIEALELGERAIAIREAARRFVETERTWPVSVRRYTEIYEAARRSMLGTG